MRGLLLVKWPSVKAKYYLRPLGKNYMTAEKARQILGQEADAMTDSEIQDLLNFFSAFADLVIDSYLNNKKMLTSVLESEML